MAHDGQQRLGTLAPRRRSRRDHHAALLLHERHARLALRATASTRRAATSRSTTSLAAARAGTRCSPRPRTATTSAVRTVTARPTRIEDRCRNNANFGTPGDGASPRMQMYMWIADTALTATATWTVTSSRTSTATASPTASSAAEASATTAATSAEPSARAGATSISYLKWGDAVVGEYVTGNATTRHPERRLRQLHPRPSRTTTRAPARRHRNGQIWASAVYDIRAQHPGGVEPDGRPRARRHEGRPPANPTFLDARDGMLAADSRERRGQPRALIWSAFAGRGHRARARRPASTPCRRPATSRAGRLPPDRRRRRALRDAGGHRRGARRQRVRPRAATPPPGRSRVGVGPRRRRPVRRRRWASRRASPTVGQDGVYTVGLQVTDAFGHTDDRHARPSP